MTRGIGGYLFAPPSGAATPAGSVRARAKIAGVSDMVTNAAIVWVMMCRAWPTHANELQYSLR
jgi:hypothetical protein